MKYIKTFEAYVTYDELRNKKAGTGWGIYPESTVETDLRGQLIKLFIYGGISNHISDLIYTDQSTDKGIKWQIEVKGKGSDFIHAYKNDRFFSHYEWYLNKKKSSEYEIQQYFLNKYVSDLDKYVSSMKSYDINYQRSDDSKAYRKGGEHSEILKNLYANLSTKDKKQAASEFAKKHNVKIDYKSFNGVN